MRKNNLVALLLMISLSMSFLYIPAFSDNEKTHVEFLSSMGVIDSSFNTEKTVTRAEFVKLLIQLLYSEIDFNSTLKEQNPFNDVDFDYMYSSYVKAAKDMGIVKGDYFSNFYPDREITSNEAIVMIINAYGYTQFALAKGGYPTGYLAVAREINMLKGISLTDNIIPTGDMILKLVYNSLFADVILMDSISNGDVEMTIVPGVNILSQKFNIKKYIGIVTDNGITSTEGESINSDDRVVIKNSSDNTTITAYFSDKRILTCLGSKVNAYLRYNELTEREELVYFSIHDSTKEVVINSQSIINVNDNYVEYETTENSGKYEKLYFETPAPKVIYNGSMINTYTNDILNPEDGIIRFVDSDNNGKYELIDILSFNYRGETNNFGYIKQDNPAWNIVVDSINLESEFISCKLYPALNNLDIDSSKTILRFVLNDNIKTLEDIKATDIISVALSPKQLDGKKVYFLAVSDSKISSLVSSHTDDSIMLSGGEYKVSSLIKNSFKTGINNNIKIDFSIDIMGKISYISKTPGINKNYGYLIDAKVSNEVDGPLYLKLFTKNGKIEYLYGTNKMTIDGVSCSGGIAQYEQLNKRSSYIGKLLGDTSISRPMIFEMNKEGFITKIDTDTPNDNNTLGNRKNLYTDYSPVLYTDEEIADSSTLKAALRYHRNVKYRPSKKTFDGRFYIDSNTVIISVPDIDTYGLGAVNSYLAEGAESVYGNSIQYDFVKIYETEKVDSNYKLMTVSDLRNEYIYDAQGYDIDVDTGVASLLVIRGVTNLYPYGQFSTASTLYVYLKMTTIYDIATGKSMYKMYYTRDGINEEYAIVDCDTLLKTFQYVIFGSYPKENPYGYEVSPLKPGDIIRLEKTGNKLTHFNRVLILDEIKNAYSSLGFPHLPRAVYSSDTTYNNSVPYDMNRYDYSNTSTREYHLLKPRSINGNMLSSYLGHATLNDIDETDQSTFTIEYYDMAQVAISVLTIEPNGEVKVRTGGLNDIKIDKADKSTIFLVESEYQIEQFIVINDER